jgi:phosphocarrier protein HPr
MLNKEVQICNRKGLHARAASKLVQLATKYQSKILLSRDGQTSDAKSILGVLVLAAHQGSYLMIIADGSDEKEAVAALSDLINRKFDEGE